MLCANNRVRFLHTAVHLGWWAQGVMDSAPALPAHPAQLGRLDLRDLDAGLRLLSRACLQSQASFRSQITVAVSVTIAR